MQQFAYRATDRFGNTVDGNITAANHAAAILQIQQLGYTPIGVQVAAAAAAPAPVAVAAGKPTPVDLTQPVTAMPAAAVDLYQISSEPQPTLELSGTDVGLAAYPPTATSSMAADTTSADDRTTRMAHLEPWERVTPDAPAGSVERTVAMMPGGVERPRHRNQTIRGLEKIPFGANSSRVVGVWQRFRETIVYPLFSGVKLYDLAQWYRQLATLIGAGLNINQSLTALADNTKNARLKEIALNGALQVRAGGYFSDVMAAYPWIFPAMHLEMLRASEHGGMIEDTLRQIGDYVEHEMEVRRLISRETLYPKIVLVVLVMLMGASGIFTGKPAVAKLVLGLYSTQAYLMDTVGFALAFLIPALALVAFLRLFGFNSVTIRHFYDEVKIRLPVVGKIIRNFAISKFARTYAALSKAGFPSSSALQIAGDASGNVVMARAGQFAAVKAEQGALPSQSLGQTAQFSHMTIDMLRTAEVSGSIDEMMEKVADYHEAEAKSATHVVCMIFSVFVLLVVGIMVGFTVIGQYSGYANSIKSAGGE
jgi:type II secretory pathway component PulF